jgi:hypothetical protein
MDSINLVSERILPINKSFKPTKADFELWLGSKDPDAKFGIYDGINDFNSNPLRQFIFETYPDEITTVYINYNYYSIVHINLTQGFVKSRTLKWMKDYWMLNKGPYPSVKEILEKLKYIK